MFKKTKKKNKKKNCVFVSQKNNKAFENETLFVTGRFFLSSSSSFSLRISIRDIHSFNSWKKNTHSILQNDIFLMLLCGKKLIESCILKSNRNWWEAYKKLPQGQPVFSTKWDASQGFGWAQIARKISLL